MSAIHCLLCGKTAQPGKRFYLRENNEPSVCVQSLLDNGSNSTEIEAYLKLHGAVCKGKCQGALQKLVKVRTELKEMEKNMKENLTKQFDIIASTSIFSSYVTDFHVTNAFMWFEPCD